MNHINCSTWTFSEYQMLTVLFFKTRFKSLYVQCNPSSCKEHCYELRGYLKLGFIKVIKKIAVLSINTVYLYLNLFQIFSAPQSFYMVVFTSMFNQMSISNKSGDGKVWNTLCNYSAQSIFQTVFSLFYKVNVTCEPGDTYPSGAPDLTSSSVGRSRVQLLSIMHFFLLYLHGRFAWNNGLVLLYRMAIS